MSHTPGPWRVGQDGHNILSDHRGDRPALLGSIYHDFGHVIPTGEEHAEAHANARLIAAAPELLAACQRIYNSYGETSGETDPNGVQTVTLTVSYEVMAQVAAAITKATGTNFP